MSDMDIAKEIVRLLDILLGRWSKDRFSFCKLFNIMKLRELQGILKGVS